MGNKNKLKITKDKIEGDILVAIKHSENTKQLSYLFCDIIEYMHDRDGEYFDHHLMFYKNKKLIFKVWLRNNPEDKKYKNIKEAMKDVGVLVV